MRQFCCAGLQGAPYQKPTGRPPTLSPTPQAELATLLDAGPVKAGFGSACWRSPMIQQLMYDRCGIFSNVFSIAQWLKHLGCSSQQAACVSAPLDEGQRQALWLCGDEASFPQWGTLSSTWARRGHQPLVKTSGKRQGDNVCGVIESCTGRFWYQGQEGRLTSAASITVLTHVWEQTTPPIILIQDGAKYHTSAAMPHFFTLHTERITVFQLPSYSPDDPPIEQLWKKVKKEGTHVQDFPTFEALTDTVEQALLKCANTPAEILSLCSLPAELPKAA